ncbi:MAG: hypothetical protein KatS3mg110_3937 [Pirellulaceae bacterium]|nr:MAG: hypothetical protein KatS3mg110_3937 [Pirellulaceae bacterium]
MPSLCWGVVWHVISVGRVSGTLQHSAWALAAARRRMKKVGLVSCDSGCGKIWDNLVWGR